MHHFSFFPGEQNYPKRIVFRRVEGLPEGQRRLQNERGRDAGEQQLQWELEGLSRDVTRGQVQDSLGRLEQSINRQELMEQDQQVVTDLIQQAEGDTLEADEAREVFFGNVEQRLTVLLVMLIRSRQLNYREFTTGNQQALLGDLMTRKDQLRINVQGGSPRQLLPQEKSILDLTTRLPNHALQKVKDSWGTLLTELKNNVQAVDFAADIVAATGRGEVPQPPQNLTTQERGAWDKIKDKLNSIPDGVKTALLITAAIGGGILLLNKLFRSNSGSGSILKFLGIGALIAGVFVAGKYLPFASAVEKIREGIEGLTDSQVADGMRAFVAGDLEGAKRHWGESYETLRARMLGERQTQTQVPPGWRTYMDENGVETFEDPHGIKYVRPRAALGNFMTEVRDELRPVTGVLYEHRYVLGTIALGGLGVSIYKYDAIREGLSATKDSCWGFAKLLAGSAVHHPFISLMVVSGIIAGLQQDIKIPKDSANMAAFIRRMLNENAEEMRKDGIPAVSEEHVNTLATFMTNPQATIESLGEPMDRMVDAAIVGLREGFKLDEREKIRQENLTGLHTFVNDLHIKKPAENPVDKPEQVQKWNALITHAEDLFNRIHEHPLTAEDLAVLQRFASEAWIGIIVRDGYIWWGEQDKDRHFVNEDELKCLGLDPNESITLEQRYEFARKFSTDPRSLSNNVISAGNLPIEDVRNGVSHIIDRLHRDEGAMLFVDGGWVFFDAIKAKYFKVPIAWIESMGTDAWNRDLACKEVMFEWADGIVPIAIVGSAKIVGTAIFARNFKEFGGMTGRIVFETVAYPFTGPRELLRGGLNRLIRPFFEGRRAGGAMEGLRQVARHNAQSFTETFSRLSTRAQYKYSWLFNKSRLNVLNNIDTLEEVLVMLRQAENTFLRGESTMRNTLETIRDFLGKRASKFSDFFPAGAEAERIEVLIARVRGGIASESQILKAADKASEILSTIRKGGIISLDDLAKLKLIPDENLKSILRVTGMTEEGANKLAAAIARGNLDELADVMRETRFITENSEVLARARVLLDNTIDLLKRGGQLGLDGLGSLKNALSQLPNSQLYRRAVEGLQSLRGATAEKVTSMIEALKTERYLGRLIERLRSLGSFFNFGNDVLEAATSVDDVIRAGRSADWLSQAVESGRLGSWADEMSDAGRAASWLDEGADATRAGNVATEVASAGNMRAAADELLRASRGANTISPTHLEGLRSLANSHPDDLRAALRALDLGDEQITAAMRAFATADRNHVQLFAALQEARILPDTVSLRLAITESAELSEAMRILAQGGDLRPTHFEALRQLGQLDEAADTLRAAGVPATAANEVAATLRTESSLARIVSRISSALPAVRIPFASGLLRIGRFLAPAVSVVGAPLGAAFAIYESRQQFMVAQEFRNNPDVVTYLEAKAYTTGTVGVVGLAADIGITIGVGMSAAAVPLILLAGSLLLIQEGITSALDAAAEQEMDTEDFLLLAMREGQKASGVQVPQIPEGQRPTPEQSRELMLASLRIQDQAKRYLIHQWYTTGDDLQMGERTLAAYTFWTTEELHGGRGNTRSDMISALIKLDTSTELQSNADYMSYRFSYIASQTADLNADSYAQAQSLLAQSKIFADTMRVRESDGVGVVYRFQSGPGTFRDIDISRPEYNPSNIEAVDVNAIYIAATRANNDALIQELGGGAEGRALLRRLNNLDPNYIQFAMNVLESYLVSNIEQRGQEQYDRLDRLSITLQIWARSLGIAFTPEPEIDPYYEENLEGVLRVLTSNTLPEADLNRELAGRLPNSPGTAVFYTLAQYFGYNGSPNIALLRRFFNEGNAIRTGVYWDGSNWRVNERWDYDDNSWRSWVPITDDETTNNAALRVIDAFKAEPSEVIESTRDSSIDLHHRDDLEKRVRMVNALAGRMQSAYDSTRQRLDGEGVTTDTQRSAVAAGVESLASDARSGFSTMADAASGNTTGLQMAGEQVVEEIKEVAPRPVANYIQAVQERGIDWDRTLKPWKW